MWSKCRAGRAAGSPRPGARVWAGPDVKAVEFPEELLWKRPQNMAPGGDKDHTEVKGPSSLS